MAGSSEPVGGVGNDARNQISTIIENIVVPARCKNILARVLVPMAILRTRGSL